MVEVAEIENPEFKWGKKRGIGGKKKDVQFYESFTYDGVKYTLYDSVYLYKEHEPVPYVGKLIKIWEHSDKTKKVKVLWFFRPCEIANFLVNDQTIENELFLACGEGVGLANINPLEAIAGKCNVVCISKDSRNPQPSNEELQMSDYVFYRTFDVGHRQILDKMDEKIAGIEVKFLFNQVDRKKSFGFVKLDSYKKEDGMNAVAGDERVSSSKDVHEDKTAKTEDNSIDALAKEIVKALSAEQKSLPIKVPTSSINIESGGRAKTNDVQENVSSNKTMRSDVKENAYLKVPTFNHRYPSVEGTHTRIGVDFNEVANTTDRLEKISSDKTSLQSKLEENSGSGALLLGETSSLKEKVASQVTLLLGEKVRTDDRQEKVLSDTTASSSEVNSEKREGKGAQVPISLSKVKGKLKSTNDPSKLDNRPFKRLKRDGSAIVYDDNSKNSVQQLGCDSDCNNVNNILLAIATEDKSKHKQAKAKESHGIEKGSLKRIKDDENLVKLSNGNISRESAIQASNFDKETDNQVLDVTRQPNFDDRSSWFKEVGWEKRIHGAHKHGKLVLLENLDPSCTSKEVEDIIRDAFEESCSAKMVQRNAFSSPHSGQAYVIFKTKEAAEMVITKLNEGCLMLSNGRPLVGSSRAPFCPKKQSTFNGHIVLEKLKFQIPRETREALSTSHSSQPNTVEFDMAMEWIVQQQRSVREWKLVYKRQGEELGRLKSKLKANLKSK